MREGRPSDHAQNEYRGIAVPLSGHEQLPTWASPGQGEGEPGQDHASEVPEGHRVSHRLLSETGMKLPQYQIHEERGDQKGKDPPEQVGVPKKNQIPEGPHSAEPASLGQKSYSKTQPNSPKI